MDKNKWTVTEITQERVKDNSINNSCNDIEAKNNYKIGLKYYFGHWGQNYKTALKYFRIASQQGNADAQYYLGRMHFEGLGINQNFSTALKWLQKAAEQGNSDAMFYLGQMYEKGEGVLQSKQQAMEWYHKSSLQGNEKGRSSYNNLNNY